MREILFRGKRKDNGEWVEGCLHFQWGETTNDGRATKDAYILGMRGEVAEVDPETVGQYTGLTDKNGTKIFEGDVVKAVIVRDLGGGTENREETGIVGYDTIGMMGLIAKYEGSTPVWSDFFHELTLSGCIDDFWCEVIGNVYDHKELLNDNEM